VQMIEEGGECMCASDLPKGISGCKVNLELLGSFIRRKDVTADTTDALALGVRTDSPRHCWLWLQSAFNSCRSTLPCFRLCSKWPPNYTLF
jgi:hypothetical protein